MISKKTKKVLAITLSLGVMSSSAGIINSPAIAYAEEAGIEASTNNGTVDLSSKGEGGQTLNNEENDNFGKADGKLDTQINDYIHGSTKPEDIKEGDISSILSGFSCESTTGSAVTIKAKEIKNFENDGFTCSFAATLYEDKDGGSTYSLNYSNKYNEEPVMLSASLLGASSANDWSTTDDIKNDEVSIKGLRFKLNDDKITVSIKRVYDMETFKLISDLELPDKIISNGKEYTLTTLLDCAFQDSSSLTSVTIPNSIVSIDPTAFYHCLNLSKIEVKEGNTKYKSENGILFTVDGQKLVTYPSGKSDTAYMIPNDVKSIGASAFAGCKNLENIKIPGSIVNIEIGAFCSCSKLRYVEIEDGVEYIGESAFMESGLESINIPKSVKTIDRYAFSYCENLKDVELSNGLETIGESAFEVCNSIEMIEIPQSVKKIDACAFSGCTNLKSICIPNKTNIGGVNYGSFGGCDKLTALLYEVSEGKDSIEITDIYTYKNINWNTITSYIGSDVIIPNTICKIKVTGIKEGLFNDYVGKITDVTCYDAKIKEQIEKTPAINAKVTALLHKDCITGDCSVIYDGKPHSVVIEGAPEGTTITYSKTDGGEYTSVNPEYTEKGTYTVYYKVSGGGYDNEVTGSVVLNIAENPVQIIEISTEGGVSAISTKGGSLKLTGVVSPSDARIKALKWSITSGSDMADISEDGVLTAKGTKDGTITARAEATDGSNVVSNELTIILKNQVSSSSGGSSSSGSSSSSNNNVESTANSNKVVVKSKDETSIINAINNKTADTIVINLNDLNNTNTTGSNAATGIENNAGSNNGADLTQEAEVPVINVNILNALKANPNKTLIIKSERLAEDGVTKIIEEIQIKAAADGQIQFTKNNAPLTGLVTVANGEYCLTSNGTIRNGWIQQSPTSPWQHFNSVTGVKEKGWFKDTDGKWYYLDKVTGIMKTGWLNDNGIWYYLNKDGSMKTGWFKDSDGKWYYLNSNGSMAVNSTIDGYYVDASGIWAK